MRIDLPLWLELVRMNKLRLTLRADLTVRKGFHPTVLTLYTDQPVPLILQTPMSGETHVPVSSLKLITIARQIQIFLITRDWLSSRYPASLQTSHTGKYLIE
jgi:hypothetical protein